MAKSNPHAQVWVRFPWVPERGFEGIHVEDRDTTLKLQPSGKLFRIQGKDGALWILRYREILIRVSPQLLLPVPFPAKDFGEQVLVDRKDGPAMGFIEDIHWHEGLGKPWFHVRLAGGKKLSRRYFAEDLKS